MTFFKNSLLTSRGNGLIIGRKTERRNRERSLFNVMPLRYVKQTYSETEIG